MRRIARWLAAGGAAASLAAAVVAPGAAAQVDEPVQLPDSFGSSASAAALNVSLLTPPLLPVEGLFAFGVAEGRGTYESSNQEARASLVFPGNGLVLGPPLACSQFPPEARPIFGPILDACAGYQFPLSVVADSLNPDGQTEGALALGSQSDPLSVQAIGGRAHAGLDATTTDSEVGDVRLLGAPAIGSLDSLLRLAGLEPTDPTIAVADGATATTDQRIVSGALVSEARATVTGLRLLGGLVHIGSVVSRSAITSAPGGEPVVDSTIELGGVTVAGTPAQVTEDGLILGSSPSGPLAQQLASQVAALLQSSGFRIEVLPVEQGEIGGIPFASAGGVLIEFTTPVEGLPPVPGPLGEMDINGSYGVRIQAGTTGVRGFADTFGDTAPIRAPVVVGGGGVVPPAASPGLATPGRAVGAAPAPAPAAAPAGDTATGAAPTSAFSDLFADRLAFVYLSFTLSAVALCLTPKLTLPARLPGAHA